MLLACNNNNLRGDIYGSLRSSQRISFSTVFDVFDPLESVILMLVDDTKELQMNMMPITLHLSLKVLIQALNMRHSVFDYH